MTDEPRSRSRRTILKTICYCATGITVTSVPLAVSAGSRSETADGDRLPSRDEPSSGETLATHPDAFVATVDRIVDGRHVVILLEDDGEPVDELVADVDSEPLPAVTEGDVLVVVLTCTGDLADARVLEEETQRRRERNRDRLEDLLE